MATTVLFTFKQQQQSMNLNFLASVLFYFLLATVDDTNNNYLNSVNSVALNSVVGGKNGYLLKVTIAIRLWTG